MNLKAVAIVLVVVLVMLVSVIEEGQAQSRRYELREGEMANQVDRAFSTAGKLHNRQKFFSILIFVLLGGAVVFAQLRGIQKVAQGD